MMATNRVFKLFFQNDDEEDVRKLILNSSEITFEKLVCKIQELQEISFQGEESVTVQYLDQDGDKVTVATTEELINALSEQDTQPYKFKVKVKRKVSSSPLDVNCSSETHHGIICTCCHEVVKGFRYKCIICSNYDICQRCEAKGTHPAHDMLRIASPSRNYPPHFFSRLQRMYEKLHHPQNSHSISSVVSTSSKSLLEPMAKDLLDNADENAVNSDLEIMDLESYMTAADEETLRRPESSLPSIEELTKNVQNLIDKDNAEVTEEVDKLTLQEIKEEKVKAADTKSESFEEKIQEVEKCQEEHELLDVHEKEEDEGQKQEDVNTNDDDNKSDEKSSQVEIPEDQNNRDEKVKFDSSKQGLSESKSRNTLSKLQDEIDKLLAPLTPNAVTPKEELVEVALKQDDEDDDDRMSISSTVSSSPFELCEITEAAIIEHNGHHSSITPVNEDKVEVVDKKSDDNENKAKTSKSDAWIAVTDNNADQINDVSSKSDNKKVVEVKDILKTPTEQETFKKEDKPKEQKVNNISVRPKLKIGISLAKDDLIEVLDTEEIKEPSPKPSKVIPKSESPVSPEEAQALLKIVDDYDRKSQEPVPNVDNYMLASSRLMLKRQLRQNVVDKNLFSTAAAEVLGTRSNRVKEALSSRTNHYSSDTYDYRPPYVVPSSMTSSYSAGDDYTSSRYSTRPSSYHFSSSYNSTPSASGYSSNSDRNQAISDAVGQIRSMGFTDEDGWLTQLCTIKRGNVADILDVLLPVKR